MEAARYDFCDLVSYTLLHFENNVSKEKQEY